jgi:SAM-dependent MidA family methyltransferase
MTDIRAEVLEEIEQSGPISFARYMELALYSPGGYYSDAPVGADRDFVTSPHVHPVFARLLASAIRELHGLSGAPTDYLIAEVGAGDGTLARSLTGELDDLASDYVAVETSPGSRESLSRLAGICTADSLEGEPQLILCHELLDNLPFRRFRGTEAGTEEVLVGSAGGELIEVLADLGGDMPDGFSPDLKTGEEATYPEAALAFIDEVAEHLTGGYALLIDYGKDGSPAGEPHGYRDHVVVEDLLADPGKTDITAGVDFSLMATRARERGLTAFPTVSQRDALLALGFEAWLAEELGRQTELMDERDGAGAVRVWSGRNQAMMLVDPAALGRHRWLLLATTALAAPSFMPARG